jgi:CheY-like chemotaxis protein
MAAFADTATAPDRVLEQSTRLCILVVEDDEADAYLISRALSDNPAVGRVVHAHDGIEALAMVERGEVIPDLAFVDLRMPRMDGLGLLVAFASRTKGHFPAVVLTSSAAPKDAVRGRLRGAIRVVTKPDTVTELCFVLNAIVEGLCRPDAQTEWSKPGENQAHLLMSPRFPGIRRALAVDGPGR